MRARRRACEAHHALRCDVRLRTHLQKDDEPRLRLSSARRNRFMGRVSSLTPIAEGEGPHIFRNLGSSTMYGQGV
jgi:hypothetical protein